ncbi:MAG: hypothetical protein KAS23_01320 [Anaerohalosphaera sp.]|nr:hypothetical protein [Anaerohalosphaera sp.]
MAGVILVLIVLIMWASLAYTVYKHKTAAKCQTAPKESQIDDRLHCRIEIVPSTDLRDPSDVFAVKIRGLICAPEPSHKADIEVFIDDITQGNESSLPVLCNIKHWQMEDSPAFCYKANYGRIPHQKSTLTYWTTVVKPSLNMLSLPRHGERKLQFSVSLTSSETGNVLAQAAAVVSYNNPNAGYLDIEESHRLTEALTIHLALAVNQQDQAALDKAHQVIDSWIEAKTAQCSPDMTEHLNQRLTSSLSEAIEASKDDNKLDTDSICQQLRNIASQADKLAAMELTLRAASPSFTADIKQTQQLQWLKDALEIDDDKFRLLCQKILPLNAQQSKHMEFILGINHDMDDDTIRLKLNDEYKRWNGRVNHPDQEIRDRVKFMLELIANARTKCTKPTAVNS